MDKVGRILDFLAIMVILLGMLSFVGLIIWGIFCLAMAYKPIAYLFSGLILIAFSVAWLELRGEL